MTAPDWTDEARALLAYIDFDYEQYELDAVRAALRAAYERGFRAGWARSASHATETVDVAWRRHSGQEPEPQESPLTMEDIRARYE